MPKDRRSARQFAVPDDSSSWQRQDGLSCSPCPLESVHADVVAHRGLRHESSQSRGQRDATRRSASSCLCSDREASLGIARARVEQDRERSACFDMEPMTRTEEWSRLRLCAHLWAMLDRTAVPIAAALAFCAAWLCTAARMCGPCIIACTLWSCSAARVWHT
ncbi:hypothetical protein FA09DRAFT_117840 [Tilletiopsis washingtonensis]|uniref:Uncharacterized protein n=1 Tax=Tilletiopsis washingtonensis TaxID=58919 RepID=A0A316ZKP3_9BASI|nr:hypothetical protein FA09DRAFT_117840 [Tilletiopsis washingtonensis]PWO00884.1 hypothetical protein FA09DRAFT_117840 [Tilletiopsis washingtonensis]